MFPPSSSRLSRLLVLVTKKSHFIQIQSKSTSASAILEPVINLSRPSALVDEAVCITVSGLQRGQEVTLQSFVKDGSKSFGSCGHYIADEQGGVNTFTHESHGGTFDGVEPMGLFWSMKDTFGVKPKRFLNSDVTKPFKVRIALHSGFVDFNKLTWTDKSSSLASRDFHQWYKDPGVKCIPVKEDGLLGNLFLPEGEGPFPAVIDVFGMTRHYPSHRSSLLASKGVASFVLAYVGHEGLAKSEKDLDFTYFLKAFDWLARHPSVKSDAMGGLGSCIGGAYVSVIAWKRPAMKCFAGINSVYWPQGPTQIVEGEKVENIPWDHSRIEVKDGALSWRKMSNPGGSYTALPYWRHGIKVLHVQSEDDQCVHPQPLRTSLAAAPDEFRQNFEFVSYPGAGHILEPPYMAHCRTTYEDIFGMELLWGGQPKPHAHAQMDAWPRIVAFLKENLMR